jgi:hypothetical protein
MATTEVLRFFATLGRARVRNRERVMKRVVLIVSAIGLALTSSAAMALPKNWKTNLQAEVPKNYYTGGDACTKLVAIVRDLDVPFADPQDRKHTKISRRDRLSGFGQYGDPQELKNWVEFRLREPCATKKQWVQVWVKSGLKGNFSFGASLKCPGWAMKQNYLAPGANTFFYMDVYNYIAAPKSAEVRLWDANDYEGQGRGTKPCPK